MIPLALILAISDPRAAFDYSVKPDKGLMISVGGVPVVQGSWVQFVEPGWTKAYYNSTTGTPTVKLLDNGDTVVMFKSTDGRAYGTEQFTKLPDGLKVVYSFGWTGDKPIEVELDAGNLWAAPLQRGSLTIDGKPSRSLMPASYTDDDFSTRTYGARGKEFVFQAPIGKFTFQGENAEWVCFDARHMNKLWAKGKDLLWLGHLALPLKPNSIVTAEAEWRFEPAAELEATGAAVALTANLLPVALHPADNDLKIIPQPKEALIKRDQPMIFGNTISIDPPLAAPELAQMVIDEAKFHWDVPNLAITRSNSPQLFIRQQDLNLPAGGYEIRITSQSAIIMGQDYEGLRHAIATLGQMFFAKDGRLCLPSGIIRDWPKVAWRGVHLFVGPEALDFQQKLWNRVLEPLKFNKVVLECERTQWYALPDARQAGYMSRSDLVSLFQYYRDIGVEPIPLIQSLGHMDWLLSRNEGAGLALYPKPASCIDARRPKANELIGRVWNEAIGILHPKTIHFGLDEIGNHWPVENSDLETKLWQMQMPFLNGIAERHRVGVMCWGDQCLAPGDSVDAALAPSEKVALQRRVYIPKGSYVGDWHYLDEANPDKYGKSLQIWKDSGLHPIASAWFRPENIRGFYLAAIQAGAGTLQTTWVGVNSDEASMVREFRQFAAMVVAADYAWTGRKDDFDKLGYDPYDVFSRMYFAKPGKLNAVSGQTASIGSGGTSQRIGDVEFKLFAPYALRSMLTPETSKLPESLVVQTPGIRGTELCLAVDTASATEEGREVATLEIDCGDGEPIEQTICYGVDVRAPSDAKPDIHGARAKGLSLIRIKLGDEPVDIRKITLKGSSTFAGLRLYGVTSF
jgi:hypothetical protein